MDGTQNQKTTTQLNSFVLLLSVYWTIFAQLMRAFLLRQKGDLMVILTILLCSPLTIKYEKISKKVIPLSNRLFCRLFCLFFCLFLCLFFCLFFCLFLYLFYFCFVRIFLFLLIIRYSNMMNVGSETFVLILLIEFPLLCVAIL